LHQGIFGVICHAQYPLAGQQRQGITLTRRPRQHPLRAGLRQLPGIELLSPAQPERSAGIVTFRLAGSANQALFEQLKAEQVVCALRGGGIRLSPHFYTPAEVIEDTLALLRSLAG